MYTARLFFLFALGVVLGAPGVRAVEGTVFVLPVAPLELVTNEEHFRPFAESVRAEVERLLGLPREPSVDRDVPFSQLLHNTVPGSPGPSDEAGR